MCDDIDREMATLAGEERWKAYVVAAQRSHGGRMLLDVLDALVCMRGTGRASADTAGEREDEDENQLIASSDERDHAILVFLAGLIGLDGVEYTGSSLGRTDMLEDVKARMKTKNNANYATMVKEYTSTPLGKTKGTVNNQFMRDYRHSIASAIDEMKNDHTAAYDKALLDSARAHVADGITTPLDLEQATRAVFRTMGSGVSGGWHPNHNHSRLGKRDFGCIRYNGERCEGGATKNRSTQGILRQLHRGHRHHRVACRSDHSYGSEQELDVPRGTRQPIRSVVSTNPQSRITDCLDNPNLGGA
jgi:hypothetical protein